MGVPVFYQGSKYKPGKLVAIPPDAPPTPPDPIGDALRADAVAYWKMDEASGTRADSTTNNLDMLYQAGTVASVAGKVNNALHCVDGSAQFTASDVIGKASFGNADFSIALWVKLDGSQVNGFGYIVSRWNAIPASGFEYAIWLEDYGTDEYYVVFDSQFHAVDSSATTQLSFDTWYFVVAEYDAGNQKIKLWLNGINVGETNIVTPDTKSGDTLFIGHGDLDSFLGVVDELEIYNSALSQDEIDYLYNSGAGRALFPAP